MRKGRGRCLQTYPRLRPQLLITQLFCRFNLSHFSPDGKNLPENQDIQCSLQDHVLTESFKTFVLSTTFSLNSHCV